MMNTFVKYTLTFLICLMALGQFVQVITRYILQVPVLGLEEFLMFPTVWLYILGAVNASRENTHIRANVLEIFLKTRKQHLVLNIITETLSMIVGLWLLWWAFDFTQYSLKVWKESPTLYIPTFIADISLFLGLLLMMVYTGYHLINHVKLLISNTPENTEESKSC